MKVFAMAAGAALLTGAAAQEMRLQPGQWETVLRMTDVDAPDWPKEAVAQMRQTMSQAEPSSDCMTPEEAADPVAAMTRSRGRESCTFTDSSIANGRISLRGTCPLPDGTDAVRMSMEGSYTATTMEGRIDSEMQMSSGPGPVRVAFTFEGRRVGECTG